MTHVWNCVNITPFNSMKAYLFIFCMLLNWVKTVSHSPNVCKKRSVNALSESSLSALLICAVKIFVAPNSTNSWSMLICGRHKFESINFCDQLSYHAWRVEIYVCQLPPGDRGWRYILLWNAQLKIWKAPPSSRWNICIWSICFTIVFPMVICCFANYAVTVVFSYSDYHI